MIIKTANRHQHKQSAYTTNLRLAFFRQNLQNRAARRRRFLSLLMPNVGLLHRERQPLRLGLLYRCAPL